MKFHSTIKELLSFGYFFCIIFWTGCASLKTGPSTGHAVIQDDGVLSHLLERNPGNFAGILENPDSFRFQILYTEINRKKNNKPRFTHHYFNVDPGQYFYPASTVKLPVVLLALEKLRTLEKHRIDRNTAMITEADYGRQTSVYNEPRSEDGKPTIAHYIKDIFLASNNEAFNRLYEFLGQEFINKSLRKKRYRSARITHRLSKNMTEAENRHTNPVKFLNDTGMVLFQQNSYTSRLEFPDERIFVGRGFIREQSFINEPFDFSSKNRIGLTDLHSILQSVIFPGSVRRKRRFQMSEDDRRFVLQYMSQYPSESRYPEYDSSVWDASGKLLLWGFQNKPIPKQIRIFNKVGGAYGFLTDVAYVVDFENKIEFMISATIYCNSDGIINDDRYDYENIGFPFMKHIGQVLYDHEMSRHRKRFPDLTEFKMAYDK